MRSAATFVLILSLGVLAMLAQPAIASGKDNVTEETAKKSKKSKKITDRNHPDYVRCRTEAIIGSLARKRRICMTNAEWVLHIREGNKRSKEFVDDLQTGMNATPGT